MAIWAWNWSSMRFTRITKCRLIIFELSRCPRARGWVASISGPHRPPILSYTAATLAAMLNRSIAVIGTRRVRCACLFLWREGWGLIRYGSLAIRRTLPPGDQSNLRARSLSRSWMYPRIAAFTRAGIRANAGIGSEDLAADMRCRQVSGCRLTCNVRIFPPSHAWGSARITRAIGYQWAPSVSG